MNLYLLGDYGTGDLAWAEVEGSLRKALPALRALVRVEIPAFDTWACALSLQQVQKQAGSRDIIFHNVAPRKDDSRARQNNAGEPLLAGHGPTGALLVGPGSGYSWSLARPDDLRIVHCSSEGSQFRSRDIFPDAIAKLYHNRRNIWGPEAEEPPRIPPNRVLLTDGYGNLKTSLEVNHNPGDKVLVSAGKRSLQATVSSGAFSVPEGEASLAPGSSEGIWEVFLRGGSAAKHLGNPSGGDELQIS